MKTILVALLTFGSISASAKCMDYSGQRVCADIIEKKDVIVITNIAPDIQKKKSVALELCRAAGDETADYNVSIETKKSCNYLSTKGFFAGGMVSACLDFGGLTRGTVFSRIKCTQNH